MKNKTARMRYRIIVQEPVATQDDGGEPLLTWKDWLIDEPAEFTPTGGIEFMRGRQLEANTKAIFRVRYREGYHNQMSLLFNGERYGVTYVNPVDGMRRFIELIVSSGVAP